MLNIVLFGPPGAGKGTQSEKLVLDMNLIHLSTGDLLREQITQGTELGIEAKKLMDKGELVPDNIVIGMISHKLDQNTHAKGFIFDGFPRTTAQAQALDLLLTQKNTDIKTMLALTVNEDELMARLLKRGQTSGRPDDANTTVIKNRIVRYNADTLPVATYYTQKGKYIEVNGIGSIDDIHHTIVGHLSS